MHLKHTRQLAAPLSAILLSSFSAAVAEDAEARNVCNQRGMIPIEFSGVAQETIIRTTPVLPPIKAIVCADDSNDDRPDEVGVVQLYFSTGAGLPQGSPAIGSLEANTCMLVQTKDWVYAGITTQAGGRACVRYLSE